MPFPRHDRYWTDTAEFLKPHLKPGQRLLAPDEFVDPFPTTHAYAASFAANRTVYPWVVLHKGMLSSVAGRFLSEADRQLKPVFANEVFVVLAEARLPCVSSESPHYQAYRQLLASHEERRPSADEIADGLCPRPDIATLSVERIRLEMNKRYNSAAEDDEYDGYEHPYLWDRVRFAELDRLVKKYIGDIGAADVLDFACGLGRNLTLLPPCRSYLGVDLSDVAVERARRRHAALPHVRFERLDCASLGLEGGQFDLVLAIEMIEHVHDAARVLSEAFRALRPGGRLLINSANRDSLHLRMTRALGLPEFRATKEHIREFSFAEMKGMLAETGFRLEESAGVFLLPYHGIPDLDQLVCRVTHDDPAVVELFRDLGERAGAEYGFEFLVAARKLHAA